MSDVPKVLAVVPAKAHSSRIPGKNMQLLGGQPLFLWTVQAARAVRPAMTVMVSTDEGPDGDEIARLAVHEGACAVRRPPELCRDPAQAPDVALHALDVYERSRGLPDVVVMLLPTSPFTAASHIWDAVALHLDSGRRANVLSARDVTAHVSHKLCITDRTQIVAGPTLRDTCVFGGWHDWPKAELTGAIWVTTPERLRRDGYVSAVGALPYVMDEESSLDIDTPLDLDVARAIVARRYETTTGGIPRCVA